MAFKAVGDLIGEKFFIPYYQRGYRWEEKQVRDLLNDLWEFHRKVKKRKEEGYYSLQPLVVKKEGEHYRLIDGQQRLTTLFIIVKAIEDYFNLPSEELFELQYERGNSEEFLKNISSCREKSKEIIDFCYMCKAFEVVQTWIKEKEISKSNIKQFKDFLLLSSDWDEESRKDINQNIRFLWYELDEEEDEIETFIRLNIGKIPLTNAELIKSFILQLDRSPLKRFEIAKEWDDIEYRLEDSEFFGFLTPKIYETPIEIVFEVLMKEDEYKDYELYEKFMKTYEGKSIDEVWEEVRKVFNFLYYWFENRTLYHYIGYLIHTGKTIGEIYRLYEESEDKKEFLTALKKEMLATISSKKEDIFKASFLTKLNFSEYLEELDYRKSWDKETLKNILLLFNIITLLESNKDSYIKFSFDRYNKEKWSLEHIVPVNAKVGRKILEHLEDLIKFNLVSDETKRKIEEILEKKSSEFKEDEEEAIKRIIGEFKEDFFKDEDNLHSLKNLTLLSTKDNSSLSNAPFPLKRAKIIQKDEEGAFIPIATKNLFLKYYTKDSYLSSSPLKWSKEDGEAYLETIKNKLENFFKEER